MKKYMSPAMEIMNFDVVENVANLFGPSGYNDAEFGGY